MFLFFIIYLVLLFFSIDLNILTYIIFLLSWFFFKYQCLYRVVDFIDDHNHPLHPPETIHLLDSQWQIEDCQA